MTAVADARRHLRARAEHVLLQAAMEQLRREHPAATAPPRHDRADLAWRVLFVPVYRRIPWETKVRAMRALGMTAERSGWTAPERRPGQPWRPPVVR